MGNRSNKYRTLKVLPRGAVCVAEYARQMKCSTANIYKKWRKKKASGEFEIIIYNNFNFIITK